MSARFSLVQTVDLSPATSVSSVNLSAVPPGAVLGQCWEDSGKVYQLVQFDSGTGSVASIAGGAAYWADRANYLVTSDATDAETTAFNDVAGGFLTSAVTDGYYTVIQKGGIQTTVKCDAGTGVGEQLSGGTTDMVLVSTNNGTAAPNQAVAIALTAAAGSPETCTVCWIHGALA